MSCNETNSVPHLGIMQIEFNLIVITNNINNYYF